MRRWHLIGLIVCVVLPGTLRAQNPAHTVLTDSMRAYFATEWDKHSGDALQTERAYCVGYRTLTHKIFGTYLFVIVSARPAQVTHATQTSVVFKSCAADEAAIHIHTPTTCTTETECRIGGVEAYNCEESDLDKATLSRSQTPFAGTQCDRFGISFHYHPALKPLSR